MKKSETITFEELKSLITDKAKSEGACSAQYRRALESANERELLQVLVDNIEWGANHKVVTASVLENFDLDLRHNLGIYANETIESLILSQSAYFFNSTINEITSLENSTINEITSLENSTINTIRSRENSTINEITSLENSTINTIRSLENSTINTIRSLENSTINEITSLENSTVKLYNTEPKKLEVFGNAVVRDVLTSKLWIRKDAFTITQLEIQE